MDFMPFSSTIVIGGTRVERSADILAQPAEADLISAFVAVDVPGLT